jgi:hypothetical protein
MKSFRILFLALLIAPAAFAQTQPNEAQRNDAQTNDAPPYDSPPVQATPAQVAAQNWLPQAVEVLGQNASSRTAFSLDHSMLVLASKIDRDNDDLRRVIAGVNGVTVRSYRFPQPGMYDPQILRAVSQQFHTAGWMHVASPHHKDGDPSGSDFWIRFDNKVISNIAVLFTGENQLNFISVSGSISPLELLRLAGHFGIPSIEGGEVVPAPRAQR